MGTPYPLNSKDKKDLEVYIKQFCFKSIQSIVNSRQGKPLLSDSQPDKANWFNLSLKDNPALLDDCKSKLDVQNLFIGKTISVTITLHMPEGESMVLEIWTFNLSKKYEKIKVTFTVYNKLCLLLRSIISASRATPTYRLTRKQSHFFTIGYDIQTTEPQLGDLGECPKCERIGNVPTPSGTVTVTVFYRTSLDMPCNTPHTGSPGSPSEPLTTSDTTPTAGGPCSPDTLPYCPFADTRIPTFEDIHPLEDDTAPPFASLLESAFPFASKSKSLETQSALETPALETSISSATPTPTPTPNIYTPSRSFNHSPALSSPRIQEILSGHHGDSASQDIYTSDSFILIAPFASSSPEDIGSFFRDCTSIPKLKLFKDSLSSSSTVNPAEVEQDVREIEDFLSEVTFDD